MEARIYAEDPEQDFLHSPGTVHVWVPAPTGNARFDSGIEAGTEIGIDFDPMIAKVIVHAPTRREATARLARVLEQTRIQGLTTNRDFLVSALRTPEFLEGDTTTDFIERVNPARTRTPSNEQIEKAAIAIIVESRAKRRAAAKMLNTIPGGWRNSHMPPETTPLLIRGEEMLVCYSLKRGG